MGPGRYVVRRPTRFARQQRERVPDLCHESCYSARSMAYPLYEADLSHEIARLDHRINTRHAFVARSGSRIMTLSNEFEPARIWNGINGQRISSLSGHTNFVDGGA